MDAASLGERELDVMTVLWQRKQRAEQRRALRRLIDTLFLGSPEALLSQLVDDWRSPPEPYGPSSYLLHVATWRPVSRRGLSPPCSPPSRWCRIGRGPEGDTR